jgi:hypothetical protein
LDAEDRLAAAGLEVSNVIDHGFVHSIYLRSERRSIEFSYDVPGFDARQQPLFGDRAPSAIAKEALNQCQGAGLLSA